MGVDTIRFLVMPGLIGGCVATVIMNIFFSTSAIVVGYFITKILIILSGIDLNVQLTWSYLSSEILGAVWWSDFVFVILKPIIFGAIITTNACYQALNIPRDMRQVPKAVSRSVIKSFLYVVIADVICLLYFLPNYMSNLKTII